MVVLSLISCCFRWSLYASLGAMLLPGSVLGRARIVFPELVSFGKIDVDLGQQEFSFPITNTGDEVLSIRLAGKSCGCMELVANELKVPPGREEKVVVRFDPRAEVRGTIHTERLLFATNDPDKAQIVVMISYVLGGNDILLSVDRKELELTEQEVRQGRGAAQFTVFVYDLWKERLALKDIHISRNLRCSLYDVNEICLRCARGDNSHFYEFDVQLARDMPIGDVNEYLRFATNHPSPNYSHVEIPIRGRIVPEHFELAPRVLLLRKPAQGQAWVSRIVKVRVGAGKTLVVEDAKSDSDAISVSQIRLGPQAVDLEVSVNPQRFESMSPPAKARIDVKIRQPFLLRESIRVFILPQ